MRALQVLTALPLMLACQGAVAECALVRFGYVDQHRPPYFMGNGSLEAKPPGASVELVRETVASAGCPIQIVRLPLPRIRQALEAGTIDAAPIDANGNDTANFAFPFDKQGKADRDKALQLVTIVFVRTADQIARNSNPLAYFKDRRLGVVHGAPYADSLRKAGIAVDDGAVDATRNLDKLALGRIDGFALALTSAQEMDAFVEQRFGKDIERLETPLRTTYIWLAFSKAYYARNRDSVDAMWSWIGSSKARRRYSDILKTYDKEQ